MFQFRKIIVTMWILLTIIMGYYAFQLPSILSGSGFELKGSYAETQHVLEREFNQSSDSFILLFKKKPNASNIEFNNFIEDTLKRVKKVNNEKATIPQFKDNYAFVTVPLGDQTVIDKLTYQLKNNKDFFVSITGDPIIEDEMNKGSQNDLKNAELIGLPVALIVLIFAFGGLVSACIPIIIGVLSVVVAMGVTYFLGHYINLSIFVLNIIPMIGLALSIDFALLYINRFREEIDSHPIKEAVVITSKTAGRSIIFSGLCVTLGLSGMLFIKIDIFQSVAIGGIVVVLISVLSALTLLPSILSIIGDRINKGRILKSRGSQQASWRKFASFVMKRPILMAVTTLAILTIALFPVKDMKLEIPDVTSLPADSETRIAYEEFERVFLPSNESNVIFILDSNNEIISKENLYKIEEFVSILKKDKKVTNVNSLFTASGDNNASQLYSMISDSKSRQYLKPILENFVTKDKTIIYVTINANSTSKQAKDWVRNIEHKNMPLPFTIGGYSKYNQEIFDEIYEKVPQGLLLIIISTYLILLIAFRSVIIQIKAIIMNMFSLGGAFGIVVWMFQEGHFGIEPSAIGLMIPVIAFAVVFGLSMDYEVFLISRIQEEYSKTNDNNYATLEGLTITSRIISAAAAIMIVVTGAFAFTDIIPVKQIGIAVALSILLDATLIRMILVPTLMKLFGDWNWWMPFQNKTKQRSN